VGDKNCVTLNRFAPDGAGSMVYQSAVEINIFFGFSSQLLINFHMSKLLSINIETLSSYIYVHQRRESLGLRILVDQLFFSDEDNQRQSKYLHES
jgi:hypothetical protein